MSAVWEGIKYKLDSSDKFDDYMLELGELCKPKIL